MITTATYVHAQDSLATTKIKFLFIIPFKKDTLLIYTLDQLKKTMSPQLFWGNPNEVKRELSNT